MVFLSFSVVEKTVNKDEAKPAVGLYNFDLLFLEKLITGCAVKLLRDYHYCRATTVLWLLKKKQMIQLKR